MLPSATFEATSQCDSMRAGTGMGTDWYKVISSSNFIPLRGPPLYLLHSIFWKKTFPCKPSRILLQTEMTGFHTLSYIYIYIYIFKFSMIYPQWISTSKIDVGIPFCIQLHGSYRDLNCPRFDFFERRNRKKLSVFCTDPTIMVFLKVYTLQACTQATLT